MCEAVNDLLGETLRSYEREISLLAGSLEALRHIPRNATDSWDNSLVPLVNSSEAFIAVLEEVLERCSSVRT